jgi:general nucleoside transport system permease protein
MKRTSVSNALLAPLLAFAFSIAICALILQLTGYSPFEALREMWAYGWRRESVISALSRATPLYVAGIAVAIGFRMNLFNIGVEGQYRMATLFAAWLGAKVALPAVLHIPFIVLVGAATGALYALPIALLKVRRGVHEVISSIMLNGIAVSGLAAYLLRNYFQDNDPNSLQLKTAAIAESGRLPSLNGIIESIGIEIPQGFDLYGFFVVAIVIGAAYGIVVRRTRFGFDLRATGMNPIAARWSGVDPDRMVVVTMLLSGAVAGLIGMADLLGDSYQFDLDFATGLGFTGIAIALLGRNHPLGIAAAAFLFGWLDRAGQRLDFIDIPPEIVRIMQGVIVLAVVIAFEVVRRIDQRRHAAHAAEMSRPDVGASA